MRSREMAAAGVTAFAVTLSLAGATAVVPKGLPRTVLWAAAALVLVSTLALWIMAAQRASRAHLRRGLSLGTRGGRLVGNQTFRWASSSADVTAAHDYLASFMPEDPPSLEVLIALQARNSKSIRLVERLGDGHIRLVGVLIAAPLTTLGVRQLAARKIRRVEDAQLQRHVCTTWRKPAGIYIGGVAGSDASAKIAAILATITLIEQSAPCVVFTRPVTKDGMRIIRRHGFTPVSGTGPMWSLIVDR